MASVNKVIVLGTLGRDPEVRYSADGNAVANLSIATSRKWKDKSGEKQEETEWHRVVLYGKTAEVAEKYLSKGASAYVEGRLKTRKWTDKEGVEKYTTEIIGESLQLLGSKRDEEERKPERRAEEPRKSSSKGQRLEDMDDDIPF